MSNVVSLADYRRRRAASPRNQTNPAPAFVWVYWVPVWVW
jgi:hypothetical protein